MFCLSWGQALNQCGKMRFTGHFYLSDRSITGLLIKSKPNIIKSKPNIIKILTNTSYKMVDRDEKDESDVRELEMY